MVPYILCFSFAHTRYISARIHILRGQRGRPVVSLHFALVQKLIALNLTEELSAGFLNATNAASHRFKDLAPSSVPISFPHTNWHPWHMLKFLGLIFWSHFSIIYHSDSSAQFSSTWHTPTCAHNRTWEFTCNAYTTASQRADSISTHDAQLSSPYEFKRSTRILLRVSKLRGPKNRLDWFLLKESSSLLSASDSVLRT